MSRLSYSLHIGVNQVDSDHYQGWNGLLEGCENDALFFKSLADRAGFTRSVLLISSDPANLPTAANVSSWLTKWSKDLHTGDYLFITYSGHGGMLQDENFEEEDGQDETWCLTDRQFLDDELMACFSKFERGVRIFMISDSCHSGSVSRGGADKEPGAGPSAPGEPALSPLVIRQAPRKALSDTFRVNRQAYKALMKKPIVQPTAIGASVMLFAACQDDEKAAEKNGYGLFTAAIKTILEQQWDYETYDALFKAILTGMPGTQRPNLTFYGSDELIFRHEKPFLFTDLRVLSTNTGNQANKQPVFCSSLIIELDPAENSLTGKAGYSQPPGCQQPGYYVKTLSDANSVHAWDKAYEEYFQLRKAGCRVFFVLPGLENDWLINPGATRALRESHSWKGYLAPARFRGAGEETDTVPAASGVDDILWQMILLEIGQLVNRDPQLAVYREKAPESLTAATQAYESFIQLIRNSPYGSTTLQMML